MAIFVLDHIVSVAHVDGRSMQPTFNPDSNKTWRDLVLLDKWQVTSKRFKAGDIVTMWSPIDPELKIIKRIVAIEGDTVRTLPPYKDKLVRIPRGHVWVEGDESFHTRDSNYFGPVPLGLIESKVTRILFPFSRFGKVDSRVRSASGRVIHRRWEVEDE